jgi:hypothetical protein
MLKIKSHYKRGCIGNSYDGDTPADLDTSLKAKFKRAELGINFICSVTGSFLYLIGSIYFIPATNCIVIGIWGFIIGSIVIFLN